MFWELESPLEADGLAAWLTDTKREETTGTREIMLRWGKRASWLSLLCLGDSQPVTARIKIIQLFSNLSVCGSQGRGAC